ncbi:MAG TPA: urease accessory protein UreD, partial [Chloroflexota bacterium]|nr:urease accessory protein UreD [Chloroflexota bacterium]
AYVEFWPDPLIPGRGARYGQRTELRLAPTATVLYRDVLMAGRVARGERFAFDVLVSETRGMMQGGDLLFEDVLRLEPGSLNFDANVLLGGYDVLGTLYALNVGLSWLDLAETLDAYFRQVEPVYAGVSILPGRAGLVCRILGRCTGPVLQALETARALIRRELGKPTAAPMRK